MTWQDWWNLGENLTGIEMWRYPVESAGMNGFKSGGIRLPLFGRYFESLHYGGESIIDSSPFVISDDSTGPVHQFQIILKVIWNAALGIVRLPSLEV